MTPHLSRSAVGRRIAALIGSVVLICSASCGRSTEATPEAGTTIAVTTQPARLETLRDELTAPGTIVPAASGDFTVTAPEPGEIAELPKAEGDAVQTGELLVRFDIPSLTNEINARQIDVTTATSKLQAARAEAQRITGLFDKGLVARNALDASRGAVIDAESALSQAQAQRDALQVQEQRAIVRARFAGIVAKVWQVKGAYVSAPGEPILRVIDPNRVQALVHVPLVDFQRVMPGQVARVQPPGGPSVAGTVVLRTPPADPTATTAEVRLDVTAPTALPIDTPIQISILIEERSNVLTVPAGAIQRQDGAPAVWVAGDDGRAHRREVRIGLTAGGRAQILGGLTAGEKVIVTGLAELTEGAAIRVS